MTIRDRLVALDKQRAALGITVAKFEADRQAALAELPAKFGCKSLSIFIQEVKAASGAVAGPRKAKAKAKKVVRRRTRVVAPSTPAESPATPAPVPVEVAAVPVVEPASASPVVEAAPVVSAGSPAAPVGTDLGDPRNFSLLPDSALLEEVASPGPGYYDRLSAQLVFARKVIAAFGVPAAVWAQWRHFEDKAGEILRNRYQVPGSF